MNIVCLSCTTRIQLDDTKIPSQAFTVRCPKCRKLISIQPSGRPKVLATQTTLGQTPSAQTSSPNSSPQSAPVVGEQQGGGTVMDFEIPNADAAGAESAATTSANERTRFSAPTPAPLYRPPAQAAISDDALPAEDAPPLEATSDAGELARALIALLQKSGAWRDENGGHDVHNDKRFGARRQRKVLTCVSNAQCEAVAAPLAAGGGYEVYVAADAMQGMERLRHDQIDIIVLDTDFDAKGQGSAFINRELAALRPASRRQLFVIQLSVSVRSADAHLAFLHNVNMVVHPEDLAHLPQMIETVSRDHEELYRTFREALAAVS